MKPGDLGPGGGQLREALKILQAKWDETADWWTDDKRREFEQDYVAPIEPRARITLERLNRLSQMFQQARKECE